MIRITMDAKERRAISETDWGRLYSSVKWQAENIITLADALHLIARFIQDGKRPSDDTLGNDLHGLAEQIALSVEIMVAASKGDPPVWH